MQTFSQTLPIIGSKYIPYKQYPAKSHESNIIFSNFSFDYTLPFNSSYYHLNSDDAEAEEQKEWITHETMEGRWAQMLEVLVGKRLKEERTEYHHREH